MAEERGERGGFVLDKPDTDVTEPVDGKMPAGEEGDAALAPIEEDNEVVPEQGGDSDPDGGTEDNPIGKDGSGKEGEVPEGGEEPGPKGDDRLELVEKTLNEIREKINEKPAEEVKPLTDEQWGKIEGEWGIPRTAIERQTQQVAKVYDQLTQYVDGKFAKLEFDSTLSEFSKTPGFQDATRYKKEMGEFLKAYDPKHWTNPEVLKRGVYYARGLNANTNIQKARNDSERNRRIAGTARPASPASGFKKPAMPPLTQLQKEAAALMPGGEAEYNKFRPKSGRVILER